MEKDIRISCILCLEPFALADMIGFEVATPGGLARKPLAICRACASAIEAARAELDAAPQPGEIDGSRRLAGSEPGDERPADGGDRDRDPDQPSPVETASEAGAPEPGRGSDEETV